MKRRSPVIALYAVILFILWGCSIKDDIDESIQQADCLSLIAKINNTNSEDRACADIIADIDKITKECNQFLEEDTKARLAEIKADCTDN